MDQLQRVAIEVALRVRVRERREHLARDVDRGAWREPLAAPLRLAEQRAQIAARQILHHDEVLATRRDEVDRVDDVRVIERRG